MENLNKKEMLDILKKYDIYKDDFVILSGASMVLMGVKEVTCDIDIAVSNKLYNELLEKYNCVFEKRINGYDVWYIDGIINFSEHYYSDIKYTYCLGYKVQDINSILELKKSLNRDKDIDDIEKIVKYKDSIKWIMGVNGYEKNIYCFNAYEYNSFEIS